MSDTFDYEYDLDHYYCNDGYHPNWNRRDKSWETKDGRYYFPYEMEDSHLINTINLTERNGYDVPYEMKVEAYRRKI